MAPVIGIVKCSNYEYYEYAIKKHGGKVKKLTIGGDPSLRDINGLLLTGSGDIDPELYGEERHPETTFVDRESDDFELSLFNEAIDKNLPVFGICRGLQIINVACGGNLYQDIAYVYPRPALNHKQRSNGEDSWHDIEIESASKLIDIVGKTTDLTNSAHHQAIKELGAGLVITARSIRDNVIEAIEYPENPFVIAVQYHPERMGKDKKISHSNGEFLEHATKLFKAFIRAS